MDGENVSPAPFLLLVHCSCDAENLLLDGPIHFLRQGISMLERFPALDGSLRRLGHDFPKGTYRNARCIGKPPDLIFRYLR